MGGLVATQKGIRFVASSLPDLLGDGTVDHCTKPVLRYGAWGAAVKKARAGVELLQRGHLPTILCGGGADDGAFACW